MNPWDQLCGRFNPKDGKAITSDNILIAWPALFEGIGKVQATGKGLTAHDYGCGAGALVADLGARGYRASGSDTSEKMITVAQKNAPEHLFRVAGHNAVKTFPDAPFDLITSVMVLPFVQDIQKAFRHLDAALAHGGVLGFVSFNPDFITLNTGRHLPFAKAEAPINGTDVLLTVGGEAIPVYARDETNYASILEGLGYKKIHTDKPPYTPAYLAEHPTHTNTSQSQYLVMVYQKG